ncbi:MAG: trigger factor [Pseudomonadota bacterium]
MQVIVETTGNLGRRMTVAVPAARMEQEIATRLKRLSQTARFPGFRPGKAPMKMVEAQYAGKVLEEVAGDLIRSTFYEAVNEKGLKPAGGPDIQPKNMGRGKDFEYTATFEIYPEVRRLEIKGSRIERPVVTVSEDDVNRTIDTLRRQRVGWNPVERAAAMEDRVLIDFQGMLNGVPFEGGEAKDFPLVLGNNTLIDGFESGLIGARAGENRTLDVTFPADYRNTNLAGKKVQFAVTVKQVNEPVLPDVNDDFALALGVADGKIETLHREVRTNLERELAERVRRELREQVFKAVIEANPLDVPKALEQSEIEHLIQTSRANLDAQGMPGNQLPGDPQLYAEQARRRVTLGLILAEMVKVKSLIVDAQLVRERIEELAAGYDNPQEFVDWHYSNRERLAEIESKVMEDQAVELLLATAEAIDKPMSFQELMRPGQQAV